MAWFVDEEVKEYGVIRRYTHNVRYRPYYPDLYIDNITKRVIKDNRPVEHRVKPDDLLNSMTSQAPAWIQTQKRATTYYKNSVFEFFDSYMPDGSMTATSPQGRIDSPDVGWMLRSKIQDTAVNLSSTVAEVREVHKGFVDTVLMMARIKKRMIKGAKGKRLDMEDVANTHLAIQYGIKPLIGDFTSVLERYNSIIADDARIRIHARESRDEDRSFRVGYWNMSGNQQHSVSATCYIRPRDWMRIEYGNPVEWAWELIPFSFIVDQIVPIGEYITLLSTMSNVDLVSQVSVVHKITERLNADYDHPTYTPQERGSVETELHWREVLNSVPLPELPTVSPSTSYKSVVNNLALLRSLGGRQSFLTLDNMMKQAKKLKLVKF